MGTGSLAGFGSKDDTRSVLDITGVSSVFTHLEDGHRFCLPAEHCAGFKNTPPVFFVR
jgi:hypothetical protein